MLARVRLRLTLLFILITSIVYLTTSGCGVFRFWLRINAAFDEELSSLASETLVNMSCANGKPVLDMKRAVFHQPVSLQVFDANGNLLQLVGVKGLAKLEQDANEVTGEDGQHYRNKTVPLPCERLKIPGGFLQVQVTTKQRDLAIHNYIENVLLLAPVLLLGLAISGSYFAGWAVRPIQQSISSLRRFLADAGHELGTPLAILRSTADNLSLDVAGMPEAEERVEIMTRTTERMGQLVHDMSLLARLENAELSVEKKPINLSNILNEQVANFKELFAEKKLKVKCELADNIVINGDKSTIERVFSNLLQNAIRYTNENGSVTVGLTVKDNKAVVHVADTGIGIPPEALGQIFDRFYRVEKTRSRAAGGSGLGLAIVKVAVEAHGGSVEVQSKEGEGSQFTVTLPT